MNAASMPLEPQRRWDTRLREQVRNNSYVWRKICFQMGDRFA
jgi:hypothetical protein